MVLRFFLNNNAVSPDIESTIAEMRLKTQNPEKGIDFLNKECEKKIIRTYFY